MKRIITLIVITFAVVICIGGCDAVSGVGGSLWSGGKHELRKLDQILKDKTVVPRAYDKLEKMKAGRRHLTGRVVEENADARVDQRKINRLKSAMQSSQTAFNIYHQAATAAGLPHESKTTAADLAKQIDVDGKIVTGKDVYRNLATFKAEIKNCEQEIAALGGLQSDHTAHADDIASQFPDIDADIKQLEETIKTCERLQQKRTDVKKIEDLKLEKSDYDGVLKMDDIITDLERKIDRYSIDLENSAARLRPQKEKDRLTKPKFSVTGNDLVD